MQIGLVGLQYSGKSSLFNTLSKKTSESSQAKEEATIEVVKVPDERLDKLTAIFKPKKQVYATIEVFDIPGLKMSEDNKVKITSNFLSGVKNNDALFYVIRGFLDDGIAHPMDSINPKRDIEFLNTEFLLADMAFLESRLEKLKKDVLKAKDEKMKRELPLIEKCLVHCESELPLYTMVLDDNEMKILSGFQLLTLKPLAVAINYDENSIQNVDMQIAQLKNEFAKSGTSIVPFFAKIELELSKLNDEDQAAFMQDYGIKESALNRILRISYELLGLQSFFTVGEDECRAWTIKKNYTAQQAAGVIHTDFFNRFIRAEVVHYEDFLKYGSFSKCKEAGAWRLEGKEYIVKDGDILNIRHN